MKCPLYSQDTLTNRDTSGIRAYYCKGGNWNLEAFGYSGTHKKDSSSILGGGFNANWSYKINNINIGLGSGLERYNNSTYIPLFINLMAYMGDDDLRFHFFLNGGYLTGKVFNNTYESGQYINLGVGFDFFVNNYSMLSLSAGLRDMQLDKSTTPRDNRSDMIFILKLGYVIF